MGYEIEPIDKVQQELYCAICCLLIRNAKQLPDCGNVFCEGCLQRLAERGTRFLCPIDRKPVNTKDIVAVPFIDRMILSSKVKCTYGCVCVGELGNLKDHQPNCEYLPTKCPNKKCNKHIQKIQIDEHLKTCNYSSVPCKYQQYGCKIKLLRLEVSKHEKVHNKIE